MKMLQIIVLLFLLAGTAVAAECPGSHCSSIGSQVNEICKSDGFSGSVVYVWYNGKYCYCKCSCLAVGTPVAVGEDSFKPIEDFVVGDSVLTLNHDKKWTPSTVKFSDGTKGDGAKVPFSVFVELDTGMQLIVTPDHPFLLSTGKLAMASRLTLTDKLTNSEGMPVGIKSLMFGDYTGGIHNISTSTSSSGESMYDGHLINTAGVISGDYYAQLYLIEESERSRPTIGSEGYPEAGASPPEVVMSFMKAGGVFPSSKGAVSFTPYKKFEAPLGAVPFFPEGTRAKPGKLRPMTDTVPLEIAEYLVHHFKRFYPNVEYHIEWGDDTVNAYAWISGGRRHVALLGGLIRHYAMDVEGIGLVLAHELGHHYAGPPTYPNSRLSCEGQSDYWAAAIGMREVWWGPEYVRQMQAAIEQLDNLFTGIIIPDSPADPFLPSKYGPTPLSCRHPPAQCRKETYTAGLEAQPKPECAGLNKE